MYDKNYIENFIKKATDKNKRFTPLKQKIEDSANRNSLVLACAWYFRSEHCPDTKGWNHLKDRFFEHYDLTLVVLENYGRKNWEERKLKVSNPKSFIKKTMELVWEKAIVVSSYNALARIIKATCNISWAERTIHNEIIKEIHK